MGAIPKKKKKKKIFEISLFYFIFFYCSFFNKIYFSFLLHLLFLSHHFPRCKSVKFPQNDVLRKRKKKILFNSKYPCIFKHKKITIHVVTKRTTFFKFIASKCMSQFGMNFLNSIYLQWFFQWIITHKNKYPWNCNSWGQTCHCGIGKIALQKKNYKNILFSFLLFF